MFVPEAIFSSIIAKALAAFIEVDPKEIDLSLRARENKRLVLPKAKMRTRRIRVSSGDESSNFLVISGCLDEIAVSWSWSSSLRQASSSLVTLKGIRLEGHFEKCQNEKATNSQTPAVGPKKSLLRDTFRDILQTIKNSENFQQTLKELVEAMSIHIIDFQFSLTLPNKDTSLTSSTCITRVFWSLGSLLLDSPSRKGHDAIPDVLTRPWTLDASIQSLALSAMVGVETLPILEPFTHVATIRKVSGLSFTNMASGYEFIGREHQSYQDSVKDNSNHGLIIHLSTSSVSIVLQVLSMFRREAKVDRVKHDKSSQDEVVSVRSNDAGKATWRAGFMTIRFVGIIVVNTSLTWYLFRSMSKQFLIWVTLFSLILAVIGWWLFRRLRHLWASAKASPIRKSSHDAITVFRIPLPFISLVGPMGVSATLSKIAMLGRLDLNIIKISAESFSCRGSPRDDSLARVSATGIRLSKTPDVVLLNIDCISEIYYPYHANLHQPVKYTSLRYEKGVFTMKMKTLNIQMLAQAPARDSEDAHDALTELGQRVGSFMQDTRRRLEDTGRQITGIQQRVLTMGGLMDMASDIGELDESNLFKEASRAKLNSHLYARVMTLKTIAIMFAAIPLSKNRHRLRLYPNTFRGSEAVDYLIKCKVATNRLEAKKILRDLQIQFRLFEHVTREYHFRDEYDAIFRFVDEGRRRMWELSSVPFQYTEVSEEHVPPTFPFPVTLFLQELVIRRASDVDPFLCLRGAEIYREPSKLSHANEFNAFVASLETQMVSASNARVRALVDPDLPQDIYGLELSADSVHASPGHTTEDWYEWFDIGKPAQHAPEEHVEKRDSNPFLLPYMYIAPFKLRLSWKGVVFATKETSIPIEAYSGDEQASSNDLINYFIIKVLSSAPGLLANFRVLGINVMEQSGVVSALTVGAKFVPFGQYLAIGGIALMDGVTVAIDRGKAARDDTNGNFMLGDFARGVMVSAHEAALSGARTRGKVDESFYDDEDEVNLDPLDFAVGMTSETAQYIYSNKARFAGATVAGASVVALTVATGPIAGIILGLACGIATERAVKVAEKKFESSSKDTMRDTYDDE